MGSGARIGHLTICKGIESLDMEENTHIGNLNWITGFPLRGHRHYKNQQDRFPSLFIGRHAAITNRHLIDCSDRVIIGQYSTFAGFRSQILTHYINIATNRQMTRPVTIGKYSFVGTQSVFLPGSVLPDYSILSANSLLNKAFNEPYCLYGGVPAEKIKTIPRDSQYFTRESGYVE
jgi:acetyltransferase-like isoleucine patch superfamily enzyme